MIAQVETSIMTQMLLISLNPAKVINCRREKSRAAEIAL